MDLSRTVTEMNSDLHKKTANFSHPPVYFAPTEGDPWELGIGTWGQKTRTMMLPG